jgi:hypothetical protein
VAAEGRRRPLNGGIGRGVGSTLFVGRVEVTDEFVSYRRKRYDRVVQTCGLELPPVQFATVGVWCVVSRRIRDAVRAAGWDWLGGLARRRAPSCVYDRQCGDDNHFMDKQAALLILDRLTR